MDWNLPNTLTVARIVMIPIFLVVLYVPIGVTASERDLLATLIFVLAALTDWLDGWLARRWGQTSAFGAFLDPVADKLMVCAALVSLIEMDRVGPVIGLIVIGREITISALREWMATVGARHGVAVNWLGKFKTIAQMVAIPFLLFAQPLWPSGVNSLEIGYWLILVAAGLTVWSMVVYLRAAWPELQARK